MEKSHIKIVKFDVKNVEHLHSNTRDNKKVFVQNRIPYTVTRRLPDVRFGEPDENMSGFRTSGLTFLCPVN